MFFSSAFILGVALVSTLLMLLRPFKTNEAWWPWAGVLVLFAAQTLSFESVLIGTASGEGVYYFLGGMMLLSELARHFGLFDWVAAKAVAAARGSRLRLFALVYLASVVVTVFLSNDATAVVMTPAVLAAVKRTDAKPLPYLLTCAFVANAASFVLPISNPANIVFYNGNVPQVSYWLRVYTLPSVVSIVATFAALAIVCKKDLRGPFATVEPASPKLTPEGKITLGGIGALVLVLLWFSGHGADITKPTFVMALVVAVVLLVKTRTSPRVIVREMSLSILPLVAGLFILVRAVRLTAAYDEGARWVAMVDGFAPLKQVFATAFALGLGSNVVNNLPVAVLSAELIHQAQPHELIYRAAVVGVDLGPNLAVSGSLATLLWLVALRRGGEQVSFWKFLQIGLVVMLPALALTCLALLLGRA